MVQWDRLKTEYITSQKSYKELAESYDIPYSTLKIHARCDRWVEGREQYMAETLKKSLDRIGDQQAEDLARVNTLADDLLDKLQTAIDQLELQVIQHKEKGETEDCKWEKTYEETAPGGAVDRQGLRILTGCLKDLKTIKEIQTELQTREQEARIQKLLKDGKEDTAQEIRVSLEGPLQEYGG